MPSQSPISLPHLPPELLTAICASVDCPSVVRCRAVCRLLRDVVDGSLELQYRIELVRDGMVDGRTRPPPSPPFHPRPRPHSALIASSGSLASSTTLLTTSDRLARLRQLRKAWKTLSWTRCVSVPMPGPCCAYELVGGIFCKTQPRVRRGASARAGDRDGGGSGVGVGVGGGLEWYGWPMVVDGHQGGDGDGGGEAEVEEGTREAPHGSRTMSATWLPGRYYPGHAAVKDDLGIPTRDFAMDPSQDLMVLFKEGGEHAGLPAVVLFPGALELHVRTLSTNQAHPEAKVPVLCTPVMYSVTSVFIQIVEDVVGIMYCVDPTRLRITIWNWKTGRLVVDRSRGNLPPGTLDFSFINSRALFFTTCNGGGSIELFTFTCDRADANSEAASDDPRSASQPQPQFQQHHVPTLACPLVHVATLHLPSVHSFVRVLSFGSHTGPFLAGCPPDKPFVASNEERIHVLTIQYVHLLPSDGPRTRPKVCVFVHNRTLERYLERGAACAAIGAGEATTAAMAVPWKEWGQVHTRMLPQIGVFQWLRYVHGQRVVMLLPTLEAGESTLQVLDFNVRSAFDDVADDADAAEQDTTERSEKGEDGADPSLSRTTLERVIYPTRIVMPNIFVDVVESGLPYREACRNVRGDYSGVMIDDERLVGLKYPAFLTGDMKEIDVFTM